MVEASVAAGVAKTKPFAFTRFADLFGVDVWQLIHAGFSAEMNVDMKVVLGRVLRGEAEYTYITPLPQTENVPSLCAHLHKFRDADLLCMKCQNAALDRFLLEDGWAENTLKYLESTCHMGLFRVVFPIRIHGSAVGFLIVGGMRLAGNEGISLIRHQTLDNRVRELESRGSVAVRGSGTGSSETADNDLPGYVVFPGVYSVMAELTHIHAVSDAERKTLLRKLADLAVKIQENLQAVYNDKAALQIELFLHEMSTILPEPHEVTKDRLKTAMNKIAGRICEFCDLDSFAYLRRQEPGKELELLAEYKWDHVHDLKALAGLPDLAIDRDRPCRPLQLDAANASELDYLRLKEHFSARPEVFASIERTWTNVTTRIYVFPRATAAGSDAGRVDDVLLFGKPANTQVSLVDSEASRAEAFRRITRHLAARLDHLIRILHQQEFMAMMAHETASPLNAMQYEIAYLSRMEFSIANPIKVSLDILRYNMTHLRNKQKNWLHWFAKERKGSPPLSLGTPYPAIAKARDLYCIQANYKAIVIIVAPSISPALPKIMMNEDLLEQVFCNLLDNAIKYTQLERGKKPTINVERCDTDKELGIAVSNFGCGIRLDWIVDGLIWQRGWRNPEDESSFFVTGTGIGCAVIKEVMEVHRGRVEVESHRGGSTVPKREVGEDYLTGCKTTFKVFFPLPRSSSDA